MTEKPRDSMHQKIVLGIKASAAVAIERARQSGTPLIIWRDGKIVEISPDDPSIQSPGKQD